ncbi:MAG: extracellular solute-binding protein [Acetatifactor sp.]|nr:extracellular solute-binding protein [Acetatifactor sp.]
MKKTIYFILSSLLLFLLLTACGKETEEIQDNSEKIQNVPQEDQQEISQEDRQEVIIAAVAVSEDDFFLSNLEEFIQQFNKSQSKYIVRLETTLVEHSSTIIAVTGDDYADAVQKLKIDLVTGVGGYDLLWLDGSTFQQIDVQGLLKAGTLEDLGSWLDKKDGLERDDFFKMILDAYTLDGTIFALPAEVQVSCLSGNSDLLGDRTEWTLREFLDFAAEYPDMKIHNCWFPGLAAITLVQEGNISFVEKNENGQLIFDDKLLRDLIEYAKNGPFRQGEFGIKLANISLSTAQEYRYLDPAPKTFIGFPSQDRQNRCTVENRLSLSICSNSDCKEGAWAFLEYYLLHSEDNRNTENRFYTNTNTYPAVKEVFEKIMAEHLYFQYIRDENGEILLDEQGDPQLRSTTVDNNGYVYPPITEEDVAFVRDFLLSSRGAHLQLFTTNQICVILSEECLPYFMDEKPLDEVVKIIKGRMISFYQEQDL